MGDQESVEQERRPRVKGNGEENGDAVQENIGGAGGGGIGREETLAGLKDGPEQEG